MEAKSREEILAERMSRKKAKLSKKQNSANKQGGQPSTEKTLQANEPQKIEEGCPVKNCSPVSESSKKKTTTPNKPPPANVSGTSELDEKVASLKISETVEQSSSVSHTVSSKMDKVTKSLAGTPSTSGAHALKDGEASVDEKTSDTKNESQGVEATKSKAQLRAERRALQVRPLIIAICSEIPCLIIPSAFQEAQRTLKAQKKLNEETKSDPTKPEKTKPAVESCRDYVY